MGYKSRDTVPLNRWAFYMYLPGGPWPGHVKNWRWRGNMSAAAAPPVIWLNVSRRVKRPFLHTNIYKLNFFYLIVSKKKERERLKAKKDAEHVFKAKKFIKLLHFRMSAISYDSKKWEQNFIGKRKQNLQAKYSPGTTTGLGFDAC